MRYLTVLTLGIKHPLPHYTPKLARHGDQKPPGQRYFRCTSSPGTYPLDEPTARNLDRMSQVSPNAGNNPEWLCPVPLTFSVSNTWLGSVVLISAKGVAV